MPDKKLTDGEIVKALECCKSDIALCNECPYDKIGECIEKMCADSIDLINHQKAEIERLKESLNIELENFATEYDNKIKAEAIKEFAEKLKNEIINDTAYACDITQHSGYYDYQIKIGDIPEYIDNLVKEMEGNNND